MLSGSSAQRQEIGRSATVRRRYQHREPEKTLLHRIVRENLAPFLVEAQERYPSGELPSCIRAEFERYLRCGLLCRGFARVRCPMYHDELLVAFSCKNRGALSIVCQPSDGRLRSTPSGPCTSQRRNHMLLSIQIGDSLK